MRIDIHGMTAAKAAQLVRINLKEFYEFGYPEIEIVHGNGQGILRTRIRAEVRSSPFVESYDAKDASINIRLR